MKLMWKLKSMVDMKACVSCVDVDFCPNQHVV